MVWPSADCWYFLLASVCSLLLPCGANYRCLCSYAIDTPILSSKDNTAHIQGHIYEFECKPVYGTQTDSVWTAVIHRHMIGYVQETTNMQQQTCDGVPDPLDTVTTSATTSTISTSPTTASTTRTPPTTHTSTLPTTPHKQTSPMQTTPISMQTTTVQMSLSSSAATTSSTAQSQMTATSQTVSTMSTPYKTRPHDSSTKPVHGAHTTSQTTTKTASTVAPTTSKVTTSTQSTTSTRQSTTQTPTTTKLTAHAHITTYPTTHVPTTHKPTTHAWITTKPTTTQKTITHAPATTKPTQHHVFTFAPTHTHVPAPTYTCPRQVSASASAYKGDTMVYGNACYELLSYKMTWNDAEANCKSKGGHLTHISNRGEEDAIMKFLWSNKFDYAVWIGLTDLGSEEHFYWVSGDSYVWSKWTPFRKSNFYHHSYEDCVVLVPYIHEGFLRTYGQWDDVLCNHDHPAICRYDAVSAHGWGGSTQSPIQSALNGFMHQTTRSSLQQALDNIMHPTNKPNVQVIG